MPKRKSTRSSKPSAAVSAQRAKARTQNSAFDPRRHAIFCKGCEAEERGDFPAAIRFFQKAARTGDTGAMSNLGNIYDDALSPPKTELAVYWYKRAARNGSYSGAWNLSIHYKMRGKERWRRHWLQRAAELGDEDAIADLRREKRR